MSTEDSSKDMIRTELSPGLRILHVNLRGIIHHDVHEFIEPLRTWSQSTDHSNAHEDAREKASIKDSSRAVPYVQ